MVETLEDKLEAASEKYYCSTDFYITMFEIIDAHHAEVIKKLKEKIKELPWSECINAGCQNTGAIPHQVGEDDWEPEQCEFCYTQMSIFNRDQLISDVERLLGMKSDV